MANDDPIIVDPNDPYPGDSQIEAIHIMFLYSWWDVGYTFQGQPGFPVSSAHAIRIARDLDDVRIQAIYEDRTLFDDVLQKWRAAVDAVKAGGSINDIQLAFALLLDAYADLNTHVTGGFAHENFVPPGLTIRSIDARLLSEEIIKDRLFSKHARFICRRAMGDLILMRQFIATLGD